MPAAGIEELAEGLLVDLAAPGGGDAERIADLAQRTALNISQADHLEFPVREAAGQQRGAPAIQPCDREFIPVSGFAFVGHQAQR